MALSLFRLIKTSNQVHEIIKAPICANGLRGSLAAVPFKMLI